MRQAVRAVLIAVLVGIIAYIVYAGWNRKGSNQFEAAFNPGGKVWLDLSAGGYSIQGTTENRVRVVLSPHEDRNVQCRVTASGSNANVWIDGPSNNFQATIYVPQRADLDVNQSIGDLRVYNVEGNKHLALGIGQIQVEVPSTGVQPQFSGSVMIGDVKANAWGVDKGGFFRSYSTQSSSPYYTKAHVDIGDLVVNASGSHAEKSGDTDENVTDKDSEDDTE